MPGATLTRFTRMREWSRRCCTTPRTDFWMIFGYDGVKRVLTESETFSSDLSTSAGQPAPQWMIFFDPPHHTKLRALVALASRVRRSRA